jgi:hypothetical protein
MTSALRLLATRSSLNRIGKPMHLLRLRILRLFLTRDGHANAFVERLMQLDGVDHTEPQDVTVGSDTSPLTSTGQAKDKVAKTFDFSKHPRRKIALKFCYSGWEYSGLAHQIGPTPLPTVENVLFDAMVKAHLVDPATGLDGCGWERCGRTDRGVSAAGQVVSLWIRSQNSSPPVVDVQVDERNTVVEENSQLDNALGALALAESTNTSSQLVKRRNLRKSSTTWAFLTVFYQILFVSLHGLLYRTLFPPVFPANTDITSTSSLLYTSISREWRLPLLISWASTIFETYAN